MFWQCWVNVETMLGECFDCSTGSLHQSRFACLTFILRSTGFGDDVSYVYSPNGLYPGDLEFLTFLRTETLTELLQESLSYFIPENFLEINRYFALTSYCNTICQSNNAFSILGSSLAGKQRGHFWSFYPLADKTNNEHLPKLFFKVIWKSLYGCFCLSKNGGLRKGNTSPDILFFRPFQDCRWQTFIKKNKQTNKQIKTYLNSKKVLDSPESSRQSNNGPWNNDYLFERIYIL